MQANSSLFLNNYIVNTMRFVYNNHFEFGNHTSIDINPKFRKTIRKIDENSASVQLEFFIDNNDLSLPFEIEVAIEGIFTLENWEMEEKKSIMKYNTVAILFPYLRSIVTMLTANANVPPYVLPVMNINALFENGHEN